MIIAACFAFMATSAIAQTSSAGTKSGATKQTAKYYCPKCHAASDKTGTCAHCNAKLVKEGDYYCPGCGASSAKAGKCTACNKDMVKMTSKKA